MSNEIYVVTGYSRCIGISLFVKKKKRRKKVQICIQTTCMYVEYKQQYIDFRMVHTFGLTRQVSSMCPTFNVIHLY